MFPVTRSTSRSRFFKPAAAAAATDPFFEYVTLLLNTSATNGAQNNTFLDSSTNNFTVTRNGDTTQGSFNPYMPSGYWSGFFDGTGDYITATNNAAFDFGTGDFTVETWVQFASVTSSVQLLVGNYTNISTGWRLQWRGDISSWTFGNGDTNIMTHTNTPVVGVWNHIAVSRSGTSLKMFLNGTQVASVTDSTNITGATNPLSIGALFAAGSYIQFTTGYLSNVRVVKGTAVYTSAFTPPTTPLTAITNTSLLCLQDNRFIDNSTNAFAITRNGDTRISKFAPFNPPASYSAASYGGSGYFDGAGDYLEAPSNTNLSLSTSATDFTIEAWVNPRSFGGAITTIAALWPQSAGVDQYIFSATTAGVLEFWWRPFSDSVAFITGGTLPTNVWSHVAITRSGNTFRLFLNGTQTASGTSSGTTGANAATSIGRYGDGATGASPTSYWNGYISNLRIVKGTAVYTAAFTPPTTPLTAITNTSLLLNFTNAGIFDAATINDGQTVGNAQVSTTQAKWSPTSMGFDGTGDYVTVIDKPELRIGTGDFTIEGWVYLNATGVAYGLISKGTATTGWSVNVTSGNKLQFSYTATQLTGATSLASGTWYYFAVVRSGTASGNLRVILDGATDATSAGAVNDNFNQTSTMYVGADRVAGAVLNGYLQDVRITNGYARTTSTPTAAFPTL